LFDLDLGKGYELYQEENKPPLLFIVTKGDNIGSPIALITKNLSNALNNLMLNIANKEVWLPLMGIGMNAVGYKESYDLILTTINRLLNNTNTKFLISIPDDVEGRSLYSKISNDIKIENVEVNLNELSENQERNSETQKNELINQILHKTAYKFHLVGSNWGSEDQSNRFYKEGIWENGYGEDKYSKRVNSINEGDILFNKSTFAKNVTSYLRIKGIGIVTKNPRNSSSVFCNWIATNINVDIKDLGKYRDTISNPKPSDLITILSNIDEKSLKEVLNHISADKKFSPFSVTPETNSNDSGKDIIDIQPITNTTTLAGLISDTETGVDYLEISKDVNAFARVIAAKSFEPPLAIALLGKWGSGKSFFMRKLKEGIQTLSARNPEKQFCEGIAHVHFNAWSYMDANLWASIVTRIFEGLNEYIKNDTKANSFKKEIEKKLTQNLNIAKEEIATLEKQNETISAQIDKLNIEKKTAEDNLKKKIETIRTSTIKSIIKKVDEEFKVNEQINSALANNETFINSTNRLKKIVPEQYWMNPSELYNQIKSKYTFIKTFFYGENWWKNCLWLVVILVIVLYTPIFTYIAALLLSWQDFTLTPKAWTLITIGGTALVRGIDTYKKLKTLIAPFWKIKENYEAEKENALFEFHQKEKALKLKIENGKNEINVINEQINKAIVIKASIEFKLENALSTEALYSFIERRANSEDYKKHLGIVSIIRKDFEVLSDLLIDHKQEASQNSESKEFNAMFNKPLERIILYIDDLDRCPEQRVVEVLEAVNLLMAFPLFVVVVGVDPRWVKTALLKKYKKQFTENSENEEAISPSNYLEKIFQVPFHLKDAGDESIKGMIKTLAKTKPNLIISKTEDDYDSNDYDSNDYDSNDYETEKDDKQEIVEKSEENTILTTPSIQLFKKETIEALEITDKESELLQNMSQIIGNNPRAIKRFVNIYRIVKTHEEFNFNTETKEVELAVVMFLLALPMGSYKKLMPSLEYFLDEKVTVGFETLDTYLNTDHLKETHKDMDLLEDKRKEVFYLLSDYTELLTQDITVMNKHYQFIKRFTFKNI
jgi:hypothetical protein